MSRIALLGLALVPLPVRPSAPPAAATPSCPLAVGNAALTLCYWPGGERLARRLLALALAAPPLPALPRRVLNGAEPVRIFLAPDAPRFDSLTGGRVPEWGAGVAAPEQSVIVLPAYASDRAAAHELGGVLRHELAHIALHRYLEAARIPRWFDEGYARWAAGEWDFEAAWMLRLAFALNRAPPLDSLELAWPGAEMEARVAYLLAASAVGFLTEQSGERGLRLLLERWRRAGALEPALRRTYGLTLSQFEEDWRKAVRKRYGWPVFLTHSLVFWLFAAVLLLVLYAVRRRRDRTRLAGLRASEPPDSPAYWLEPPPPDSEPPPELDRPETRPV
ncbi:MAG: hypothetical protein HY703_11060 [Gemmatimonadetes bacterium]|nr:hypothetical protein [Gemmatimonadota bacterium]